jgi:hypothetical protein
MPTDRMRAGSTQKVDSIQVIIALANAMSSSLVLVQELVVASPGVVGNP